MREDSEVVNHEILFTAMFVGLPHFQTQLETDSQRLTVTNPTAIVAPVDVEHPSETMVS